MGQAVDPSDLMSPLDPSDPETFRSRDDRSDALGQILFVYAREHPALGYRQGMHEILSYVYLALETDLFCVEASAAQEDVEVEPSILRLFNLDRLSHDAYSLFECVMASLFPAYDVTETRDVNSGEGYRGDGGESPMEAMSVSILNLIKDVAGDTVFHGYMHDMPVPPQLYCARWVRLMFSREVVGWYNVMKLWDVFFDLVNVEGSDSVRHEGDGDCDKDGNEAVSPPPQRVTSLLMEVLECAAASMILLIRERLVDDNPPRRNPPDEAGRISGSQ